MGYKPRPVKECICYFCKKKIGKHKPKDLQLHLLMTSAYIAKLRTIYSRPDIKKAVTEVVLKRLRDSRKRFGRKGRTTRR